MFLSVYLFKVFKFIFKVLNKYKLYIYLQVFIVVQGTKNVLILLS